MLGTAGNKIDSVPIADTVVSPDSSSLTSIHQRLPATPLWAQCSTEGAEVASACPSGPQPGPGPRGEWLRARPPGPWVGRARGCALPSLSEV